MRFSFTQKIGGYMSKAKSNASRRIWFTATKKTSSND